MYHIRVKKTSSRARAVQVVYYRDRKRVVFKHIGSGQTVQAIDSLKLVAQDLINNQLPELPFFESAKFDNLPFLDNGEFLGVYYTFLYEAITSLIFQIGLSKIEKQMLLNLVVIRIVEPASKLHYIELLDTYFGIKHRRQSYYQSAPLWGVF